MLDAATFFADARLLGPQGYFIEEADLRTDRHHRALFNAESLNLWLAFFCDFYGAILVLAVSMFAVVQRKQLGAAKVGLAFSNTIQVCRSLNNSKQLVIATLLTTLNNF